MTLAIIIGATFGVGWTVHFGDLGDAFTAASWLIAVGTLISAMPIARRYPHYRCWRGPSIADGMRPTMKRDGFCMD